MFLGVEGTSGKKGGAEYRVISESFIKSAHRVKKQTDALPDPTSVDLQELREKEQRTVAEEQR